MKDVIIVGAGISGLYAGYLLKQNGVDFELYFDKLGGRIHSHAIDGIETRQDMGAEYFLHEDATLSALISDLNLETEEYINTRAILNTQSDDYFVLPTKNDNFISKMKKQINAVKYLGMKNFRDLMKLNGLVRTWSDEIGEFYSILNHSPLQELYSGVRELTAKYNNYNLANYLIETYDLNPKIIYEFVDPLFKPIYMLGADDLVASFGVLGFASKNKKVYHVKGGNSRIIEELIAGIQHNCTQDILKKVIKRENNNYELIFSSGREVNTKKLFLAFAPSVLQNIMFENFSDRELSQIKALQSIEYNNEVYHHLIKATPKSKVNSIFIKDVDTIFLTHATHIYEINKITPEYYDVTSNTDFDQTEFTDFFDSFESIQSIHWQPAYPKYTPETVASIPITTMINNNFVAGTDNFLSSMGTSALTAKLVVQKFVSDEIQEYSYEMIDIDSNNPQ